VRSLFVTCLVSGLLLLPTALTASAATTPQDTIGFTARVFELTNSERQKAGLGPLALSAQLTNAAQNYSQVLATTGCFLHTCGPVPNFAERDAQAGYIDWTSIGENIAAGYPTPEAVVAGWMASPGHRANILSPNFTEVGIGLVSGSGKYGTYWAQEFGSRPGAVLDFAPLPVAPDVVAVEPSVDAAPPPDDGAASE
jgi:uncharacterized protein YkwD